MEELWECGRVWWSVDCMVDGRGESCKLDCGGFSGEGSLFEKRSVYLERQGWMREI